MSCFAVVAKDGRARTGLLRTPRGGVETPVFMPVATQGSVKALSQEDLAALGARIILANAYHLYLRPGVDVVAEAGGLHAFMGGYPGAVLTDSGGFQVFSLSGLRKVTDEGVTFQSHLDGSSHTLTPEGVISIQARLGSDVWTCLDECPAYPADRGRAAEALARTVRWAETSKAAVLRERERGARSLFFPILQGSVYPELRREAALRALELDPDGLCLGGFSVGEPKELTWTTLEAAVSALPEDKPRYLMGMGTPEDLWEAVHRGVDMLDCVWPTRVARNGLLMLRAGGRLNIDSASCRRDHAPPDPDCACPVCRRYSRAYLCHLFRSKELSAYRLLTLHNLHVNFLVMEDIRAAIRESRFEAAYRDFFARMSAK